MIKKDAMNRVPRIISKTYVSGTTVYECFAIPGTILDPIASELEAGRGWAIQKTEDVGGDEYVTRAKNVNYNSYYGQSNCSAKDLATVSGPDYIYG